MKEPQGLLEAVECRSSAWMNSDLPEGALEIPTCIVGVSSGIFQHRPDGRHIEQRRLELIIELPVVYYKPELITPRFGHQHSTGLPHMDFVTFGRRSHQGVLLIAFEAP